jgi:hypothetical protein
MHCKTSRSTLLTLLATAMGLPFPTDAATITVDTTSDVATLAGACSLRDAIVAANTNTAHNGCATGNGPDRIVFDLASMAEATLAGPGPATITLSASLPTITETIAIRGPGEDLLVIDGDLAHRILILDSPGDDQWFGLSGLTLTRGRALGSGATGGAVQLQGGDTLEATQVRFVANQADSGGGAVVVGNSASAIFTGCTFQGNASFGSLGGGALRITSLGVALISDSTLVDNHTEGTGNGGAVYSQGAELMIRRSTLSGNSTARLGGGLTVNGLGTTSVLTIVDSTLTLNTADSDGDGTGSGGGLVVIGSVGMSQNLTLHNTILAGNLALFGDTDFSLGSGVVADTRGSHNLIGINGGGSPYAVGDPSVEGNYVGTGAAPIAPLLEALADHGGPTQTHRPMLDPETRVIDRGECAGEATDQRGYGNPSTGGRTLDVGSIPNHPSSDGCDIGAFERDAAAILPAEIFADGFELGHTLAWSGETP